MTIPTAASRRRPAGSPRVPADVGQASLDSIVSRLTDSEARVRQAQAAQVRLLAEAVDLCSPDLYTTMRDGRVVPDRERAEIAYRSVRAELACALHLSEQSVERRMNHAYQLVLNYSLTFQALEGGEISFSHTEVIVTAGRVIGDGARVAEVTGRQGYERAVLGHAVVETPGRLRAVAGLLAEQYANVTIDERYERAVLRRRVTVTDLEDGMSDLIAHLPTVQAHAIYDRLTRASRVHADRERRLAAAGAHAAGAEGAVGLGSTVGATTSAGVAAGDLYAAAALRTRDQIRGDLFSELLRTTGDRLLGLSTPSPEATAKATTAATATNANTAYAAGGATGAGEFDASGTAGIRAQVQIFVTNETLFASTLALDDDILPGSPTVDWGAPVAHPPAELVGAGPIPTSTARKLAADAEAWEIVRQHLVTGAVLSVDRISAVGRDAALPAGQGSALQVSGVQGSHAPVRS